MPGGTHSIVLHLVFQCQEGHIPLYFTLCSNARRDTFHCTSAAVWNTELWSEIKSLTTLGTWSRAITVPGVLVQHFANWALPPSGYSKSAIKKTGGYSKSAIKKTGGYSKSAIKKTGGYSKHAVKRVTHFESNWGPSAYQPNALPLGLTASALLSLPKLWSVDAVLWLWPSRLWNIKMAVMAAHLNAGIILVVTV